MVLNELQYNDNLRASQDVVFLGDPDAASRISWQSAPDGAGVIAINDARPDEGAAIFTCFGTLARSFFTLNSHWGFDPQNKKPWQLGKPDAVCLAESRGIGVLMPPPPGFPALRDIWIPSSEVLNQIVNNANVTTPVRGLHELGPATSLKLTHKGFERLATMPNTAPHQHPPLEGDSNLTNDVQGNEAPQTGDPTTTSLTHALEPEYATPFTMQHWHLPANCERLRSALMGTHKPVPLNAVLYGSDEPILPVNYASTLQGAVVEIRFSLRYHSLRRTEGEISWFTAAIEEIIVLELPTVLLPSPLQARSRARFLKKDDGDRSANGSCGGAKRTMTTQGGSNGKRTRSAK